MRYFEDLDLSATPRSQHAVLCGALGIPCQNGIKLPRRHHEHHARVVGPQSADVSIRPHDNNVHIPDPPRIPGFQRAERLARHAVACLRKRLRTCVLLTHSRHANPANLDDSAHPGHAASVVIMRVGEHENIDPPYAVPCQCLPQHRRIRSGVNEHGSPALTHHDCIALAHIEHDHLGSTSRRRPDRQRQCGHGHCGCDQTRCARGRWQRPPCPCSSGAGDSSRHHQRAAAHCDRCTGQPRQPRCHPRRCGEYRGSRPREHHPQTRNHASHHRTHQADPERRGHEGPRDRVCHGRQQRHDAKHRPDHRHRHRLRDKRECKEFCERGLQSAQPVACPDASETPKKEQSCNRKCRELQADVVDRPRLNREDQHNRHTQ